MARVYGNRLVEAESGEYHFTHPPPSLTLSPLSKVLPGIRNIKIFVSLLCWGGWGARMQSFLPIRSSRIVPCLPPLPPVLL